MKEDKKLNSTTIFDKDSDREALDSILQEVWEDESWR
nr:DinI-like family protein [Kluyvera sp. CRP]